MRPLGRATGSPAYANLETRRVVGGPAAVAEHLQVPLWHELGRDAGPAGGPRRRMLIAWLPPGQQALLAVALVTEQAPGRAVRSLPGWTTCVADRLRPPWPRRDDRSCSGPVVMCQRQVVLCQADSQKSSSWRLLAMNASRIRALVSSPAAAAASSQISRHQRELREIVTGVHRDPPRVALLCRRRALSEPLPQFVVAPHARQQRRDELG